MPLFAPAIGRSPVSPSPPLNRNDWRIQEEVELECANERGFLSSLIQKLQAIVDGRQARQPLCLQKPSFSPSLSFLLNEYASSTPPSSVASPASTDRGTVFATTPPADSPASSVSDVYPNVGAMEDMSAPAGHTIKRKREREDAVATLHSLPKRTRLSKEKSRPSNTSVTQQDRAALCPLKRTARRGVKNSTNVIRRKKLESWRGGRISGRLRPVTPGTVKGCHTSIRGP